MDNQQFEIVIKKLKTRVHATCPLFPDCKGFGKTEAEAIEKLTRSISSYVAKMAKQSLQNVLLSQNYTEVILDGQAEKSEQRKIFSVNPALVQLQKSILLRLKTKYILPLNEAEQTKDIHVLFQEMEQALVAQSSGKGVEAVIEQLVEKVVGGAQGFLLGFPLSLN